ncbi:hypothetical protein ACGF3C_08740 [Micromonospora sp. NPDC047762]|uniref:hypothetical protein n=1 Tax=Micromonospora sp. NPDC047762 TaxID=3364255 RepID=UPI003720C655
MEAFEALTFGKSSPPAQKIVRRRRTLFLLPIVVTAFVSILLFWEIVRQNLPAGMTSHWPWKLRVLDLQSAATIVTVFFLYLVTRAQYAQTVRPAIGWGINLAESEEAAFPFSHEDNVLRLSIFNAAANLAIVRSVEYRIAFSGSENPSWIGYDKLRSSLSTVGLLSHIDYFLYFVGEGYPLGTGTAERPSTGGTIKVDALLKFRVFDLKIQVIDAVGDVHERILPCRDVFDPGILDLISARQKMRLPPHRSAIRRLIDRFFWAQNTNV